MFMIKIKKIISLVILLLMVIVVCVFGDGGAEGVTEGVCVP